jgi:hypothetical protein
MIVTTAGIVSAKGVAPLRDRFLDKQREPLDSG